MSIGGQGSWCEKETSRTVAFGMDNHSHRISGGGVLPWRGGTSIGRPASVGEISAGAGSHSKLTATQSNEILTHLEVIYSVEAAR